MAPPSALNWGHELMPTGEISMISPGNTAGQRLTSLSNQGFDRSKAGGSFASSQGQALPTPHLLARL
ncbi:MAG: hypothetical protein BM558_00265 [Roseobacter sp. MedPE-SW]|nr:MAG: hypothetical protein BM558_00265 [Roseobacter sp. MedPE-SW]